MTVTGFPLVSSPPLDCMQELGVDITHPDIYAMFLLAGSPECWCREHQCHGDADGTFTGKDVDGKRIWVGLSDLDIFAPCWLKTEGEYPAIHDTFPPEIIEQGGCYCADFDRAFMGKDVDGKRIWVGLGDAEILSNVWQKKEADMPPIPCNGY